MVAAEQGVESLDKLATLTELGGEVLSKNLSRRQANTLDITSWTLPPLVVAPRQYVGPRRRCCGRVTQREHHPIHAESGVDRLPRPAARDRLCLAWVPASTGGGRHGVRG